MSISVDANFRLSNRNRSSFDKDPGLGTGLCYFVPQKGYDDYVVKHANQEEVRELVIVSYPWILTGRYS